MISMSELKTRTLAASIMMKQTLKTYAERNVTIKLAIDQCTHTILSGTPD